MAKGMSYKPPPQTLDWLGQIFLGAQAAGCMGPGRAHVEENASNAILRMGGCGLVACGNPDRKRGISLENRGLVEFDGIALASLRIGAYAQAFEHSLP